MEKLDIDWSAINDLNGTQVRQLLSLLEPKSLKYSPHTPTPKQQVFMNLDCREAFFGGAAGGGKSDALLMDALQYSDVKGYAAIIFRKTFADLVKPGALIDRAKDWLFRFPNVVWRDKDRKFEFVEKYGRHTDIVSILQFGYLETENDKYNYQGGEYQYAGFDELVHMSEPNYKYIFTRMRRLKGVQIPIKIRGASNPPDDDQGTWVFNRFVNEKTKRANTIFVPAGMDDNPHLDAEEYSKMFEELDPVTRARLKDGLWTIVRKGNMFKREWFEEVSTVPAYRRTIRSWDMAATDPTQRKKKGKEPDWTVGAKVSEANGVYYIEDICRVQKGPADTNTIQAITAAADGYSVRIIEEQEPGSSGIAVISNKSRTIFKGYDYRGVRSSGSKAQRASLASTKAERHQIKVLKGCRNLEDFYAEAESFPGGLHDDIVDAICSAIQALSEAPAVYAPSTIGDSNGSYWEDSGDSIITSSAGYFSSF